MGDNNPVHSLQKTHNTLSRSEKHGYSFLLPEEESPNHSSLFLFASL